MDNLTSAEVFANIATLAVLIFVVAIITIPKKTDSKSTRIMRQIGRHSLTFVLVVLVSFALFALYLKKGAT